MAVLGSQSSGKSTLLNRLFRTNFAVMSDDKRAQTTHGIWASRAKLNGQPFLVLDVEGADGRERGDDLDFERKSALFSLALADCLIVNLWEHSVGLYHGANMSLLRTVFDVHLQLFQRDARCNTTILFVVRDYLGSTPQANLRTTLMADMQRLWGSLNKPEAFAGVPVESVFAFEFAFLPHLMLKPAEFEVACQDLASRFKAGSLILNSADKSVPTDGMALYARSIWEQIVANRDLDLPTQQELLSQFRCDEIASSVYEQFMEMTQSLQQAVEAGEATVKFGSGYRHALQDSLQVFHRQAVRYAKAVVARKGAELTSRLIEHVHSLFLQHMQSVEQMALNLFAIAAKEGSLDASVERAVTFYEAALTSAAIGDDWDIEAMLSAFKSKLSAEKSELVESLRAKQETILLKRHRRMLVERLDWDQIREDWSAFDQVNEEIACVLNEEYAAYCQRLGLDGAELPIDESALSFLQDASTDALVSMRLRSAFDSVFKRDLQGNPRVWQPSDDMEGIYSQARDKAYNLLRVLGTYREHELIDEKRQQRLHGQLTRDLEVVFVEAKRSLIQQATRIPWWIFVLMLLLGWNEFMAILRNPLLLLACLMAAGAFFLGQVMGVNWLFAWQTVNHTLQNLLQQAPK